MDNDIQMSGFPCGQHGSYTFYKAFKYLTKNGSKRIVTLSEFFFVKLWIDSDLLCIGELQLLWIDKNSEQMLASLRLYFLPENTPEGRMDHGEDEVLAISEKVVIKVEDLVTWITVDAEWNWGKLAFCEADVKSPPEDMGSCQPLTCSLTESSLDFADVEKERRLIDCSNDQYGPSVVILSYPRYCRYRAMMKRLENVEDVYLKNQIVNALGGFPGMQKNTRVLFCRDTFDYPELEGHELLCNHLAPKLKGRPRGKRKKRSISPGSESNESESSVSLQYISNKQKLTSEGGRNGLRCNTTRRSTRAVESVEVKEFTKKLFTFMKANHTPIGRIPSLGFKELDLFEFYHKVEKLGGYDSVTSNRLWKSIFDELCGNPNSTSATTVIRRHYERFLLPYERHVKGEEYKPMTVSQRRILKYKQSESERSERTTSSESSNLEPANQTNSPTEEKKPEIKAEPSSLATATTTSASTPKPSSLRSIRVKPERQKDRKPSIENNNSSVSNKNSEQTEPEELEPTVKEESPPESEVKVEPQVKEELMEPPTIKIPPQVVDEVITLSPDSEEESVVKNEEPSTVRKQPDEEGDKINLFREVKKRKLDILKEGGLEVTPVRPSVIQQTIKPPLQPPTSQPPAIISSSPPSLLMVPNTNNNTNGIVIPQVPPPSAPTPPTHRPPPPPLIPSTTLNKVPFSNGIQKVVQSRSIFSYSEKTIYGNPKAFLSDTQHTPEVLDLSLTSPQKPVVEIVRIPQVTASSSSPYNRDVVTKNLYKTSIESRGAATPRLGSNLEITLVGPGAANAASTPKYFRPPQSPAPNNNYLKAQQPLRINYPTHHTNGSNSKMRGSGVAAPPPFYPSIPKLNKPSTAMHTHKHALQTTPKPDLNPFSFEKLTQQPQQSAGGAALPPPFPPPLYDKEMANYLPVIDPSMYLLCTNLALGGAASNHHLHSNHHQPPLNYAEFYNNYSNLANRISARNSYPVQKIHESSKKS